MVLSIPVSRFDTVAFDAQPVCTVFVRPYLGVLWRELVSVFAVRPISHGGESLGTEPASHVDEPCYRFKVSRIDTASYTAEVIQFLFFWDWADQQFICYSMREHCPVEFCIPEHSVSSGQRSEPKPASRVGFWYAAIQKAVEKRAAKILEHWSILTRLRNCANRRQNGRP